MRRAMNRQHPTPATSALGFVTGAPVLDALRSHLESVAHHHINVAGFSQPELDFAP